MKSLLLSIVAMSIASSSCAESLSIGGAPHGAWRSNSIYEPNTSYTTAMDGGQLSSKNDTGWLFREEPFNFALNAQQAQGILGERDRYLTTNADRRMFLSPTSECGNLMFGTTSGRPLSWNSALNAEQSQNILNERDKYLTADVEPFDATSIVVWGRSSDNNKIALRSGSYGTNQVLGSMLMRDVAY